MMEKEKCPALHERINRTKKAGLKQSRVMEKGPPPYFVRIVPRFLLRKNRPNYLLLLFVLFYLGRKGKKSRSRQCADPDLTDEHRRPELTRAMSEAKCFKKPNRMSRMSRE